MSSLASRLKQEREAHGWSQIDLARESKVKQSFIGALEAENQRNSGYVPELAHALGVDAYWLKTGKGEKHPKYMSQSTQAAVHQERAVYEFKTQDDPVTAEIIEIARRMDAIGKGMLLAKARDFAKERNRAN